MLKITSMSEMDCPSIDIDQFWNSGTDREHKRHRIHTYPAKFPAFIAQKAIQYARAEGIQLNCVADIFCGCGTVAFEAKQLGINFWGCDLNPTAVLIAKAKSTAYSPATVMSYFNLIMLEFDQAEQTYQVPNHINERIQYWFGSKEIKALSLLKECILSVIPSNSRYRYFFLCAFSNILKPTSRWLTKSIKPQIDPQKQPVNVRQAFISQCLYMYNAIQPQEYEQSSKTVIEQRNALAIRKRNFVDLIISSPPYVTSYEYADLHQLSTLWLGFADDYRDLRKHSIGSNHGAQQLNSFDALNQSGRDIVNQLHCVDKSKAKAVAKYYLDMQSTTSVAKAMLRPNGMALMVIGNTEYKGIHINNAKHLVESMINSGFTKVSITKRKISGKILTPYRDEKGRFTQSNDNREVYSEEFIVVGR